MENINNVKEGKKPIRGSKEKSFQGNQKKNRDNNSSSSNRFHPQNKFRKNNGENKSPKENHIAFDNFLEQKIGAETLQKLANEARKKINSLVNGTVSAIDLGVATTHHGENNSKLKNSSASSFSSPKFQPTKSYLRGKKEAIELPKEEVSNPKIFEKVGYFLK